MVSSAKIIEVNNALDAPANIADIPITAAMESVMPEAGNKYRVTLPNNIPVAPPIVNNGAKVPPEIYPYNLS